MADRMEDVSPSVGSTSFGFGVPLSAQHLQQAAQSSHGTLGSYAATPPQHPTSLSPTPVATAAAVASQMTNQQVTTLIEDLRDTDLQVRLNSFRKIQVIAQALGVPRTRSELVPYLGEFCDDDDEVLLILSSMLGEMVDAVGGSEHAAVLLPPLEQLAACEETAVREKAIVSLGKVIDHVPEPAFSEQVLPLVRRLTAADWFTGRVSATAILPLVYPRIAHADETAKKEMRGLYALLGRKEETPMVKRAAAANLGAFASVLDARTLMSEFHSLLLRLSRDEIDSVRLLIVQSCVPILRVYVKDPQMRAENILRMKPIILALANDESWRVRYMLADKFIELCATMVAPPATASSHAPTHSHSPSPTPSPSPAPLNLTALALTPLRDDDLISCFMKLLEDPELEVRTSATLKCGEFARLLGVHKTMEKFFFINVQGKPCPPIGASPTPPLKHIVMDSSPRSLHTKSALASVILQFTSVMSQPIVTVASPTASGASASPNNLIIEHLLPLILSLLADENAEVRLGLIAKLGEEGSQAGNNSPLTIEVLSSSLLPALSKLASDPKWRVRLQTIQLLPSLAAFFQQDLFHAKLFDTVLAWLGDNIWSIREAAILNLVRLTQLFGREWAATRLLPKIKALANDKSYVYRLTAVFAMKDLAPLLGAAVVTSELRPLLVSTLCADPVPNVRFNVARLLGFLAKDALLLGPEALGSVEKTLQNMKEDADADVKYCAQQALIGGFANARVQMTQ